MSSPYEQSDEPITSLAHLKRIPEDKSYVLGFAFDQDLKHVVLLEKAKPEWAAGMWNGLGGKLEPGETGIEAMVREFKEECGVDVPEGSWKLMGAFQRQGWFVECFCARTDDIHDAKTMEAERVTVYPVHEFLANTVLQEETHSGLECAWLVPYARRFLLKPEMHNEFISVPVMGEDAPAPRARSPRP